MLVGFVTRVTSSTVGDVVSILKGDIVRVSLTLPKVSVTIIVQSDYVASHNSFKVIVLLPMAADTIPDEQEPPYSIVPTSVEENV